MLHTPIMTTTSDADGTSALPGDDALLDAFIDSMDSKGLRLYPAQEEAILELLAGKHVVLNTPTGSGKSLVAQALHFFSLARGQRSFYTSPVKALVSEKFFALCQDFGAENVGMLTGDASINRDAPIICCTAEILAKLALEPTQADCVGQAILDEFHYYGDSERGMAWQLPLLTLPRTQFLLMSATMGDNPAILEALREYTRRDVAVVKGMERPVPLEFSYSEEPLHETLASLITSNKAPVYLVCFTQREAIEQAQNLSSINITTKEQKQAIQAAIGNFKFDSPFGKDIRRLVSHGIGVHHAGLLPKYRRLVEKLAQDGMLRAVVGTDTLGVGINIPIRTVLFTQLCKFTGEKVEILSVRDFQQIAGRAGRKGFDDKGWVVCQAPEHVIENKRIDSRVHANPQAKKNVVKKKAPTKGYVHWDENTYRRLIESQSEPLQSQFTVSFGLLLGFLQAGDTPNLGYARLIEIIGRCHESPKKKSRHRRSAAEQLRALRHAGIVSIVRNRVSGARLVINADLQHDFSLHHTLSLYLVDTVHYLDITSPTYALDLLTLVESILEHPHVVLRAQLDRAKQQKIDELKAQGVDFHDRINQLDDVEYPKPLRDFIYTTFNEFSKVRPWMREENIMPKSIAREMVENFCNFSEYVRDYQLSRSEGVLLRYLNQVVKTCAQTVPLSAKTDGFTEIEAFLRTTVAHADASLVAEWETLRTPGDDDPAMMKPLQPTRMSPKAIKALARTELLHIISRLHASDAEGLVGFIGEDADANALLASWQRCVEAVGRINRTPIARQTRLFMVTEQDDGTWRVSHDLLDKQGEETGFALQAYVDPKSASEKHEDAVLLQAIEVVG